MTFRLPELSDNEVVLQYIQEHYAHNEEHLTASSGLVGMTYAGWVSKVQESTTNGEGVLGKSFTYLAFCDDGKLIGFVNIRPDVPESMAMMIGHIGYGVRPNERRKGYGEEMLRFALSECKKRGLSHVIVGSYSENLASVKLIEKCGGVKKGIHKETRKVGSHWNIELTDCFFEIPTE